MNYIIVSAVSYLIGSISTSVIISKLILKDDVRKHGSGNPGTSNMMRTFGIKLGLLVLVLDMLKGFIAAYIGLVVIGQEGVYYGALASVLGHNWPIFMKFKGGKGVATTVGASLVMIPWGTGIAILVFLVVLFTTKYFSLGSLSCLFTIWLMVLLFHFSDTEMFMTSTLLTVLSLFQHRENIKRLIAGNENKMNF